MIATEPQPAEPKARRWGFRFSGWKLLVLTLLFVVSGIGLALWSLGLPLSWTAGYDRERYAQIRRAIEADPKHLLGKSFDEVTKELRLEDVPWDDAAFQQPPGMFRIYHFRGFALYVTLELLPPGIMPNSNTSWTGTGDELDRRGVLWLAHQDPSVQVDGIPDRKGRMERYWKAVDDACKRINAEMDRNSRAKSK